jgi:endonuclease/exonuclease/phosphatase family metal-dependent hydrolase
MAGSPLPASLRFRVVSWNLQHGYTPDKRHVNQEQIAFLAGLKPDVVALQEVAEWDNDMSSMYRQGLETLTGRRWSWRYEADLPRAAVNRRDGNALGSSLGVVAQEVERLDDPSAPDDNNRNRSVIRFSISEGGVRVDVATTHLDYQDAANRRSQVDRMQTWLAHGAASRIVAGDFNAEPEDPLTWGAWRGEYSDAWLAPVNPLNGAPGITMPLRSTTGRPGRLDYQWFREVQPAHVEVVQTNLSDHYALVVDWVATGQTAAARRR